MGKLFKVKMPRVMPRIKASDLTGFKKSDFALPVSKPKRKKLSIKKVWKDI
jgi:hypothetical protein